MAFTGQLGSSDSQPGNEVLGLGASPGGPDPTPPVTYADHQFTMQFEQILELPSVETQFTMQFEQILVLPDSCAVIQQLPDICSIKEPRFFVVIKTAVGTYMAATAVMRDSATYMGGYKPPSLLSAGVVTRQASDPISGAWSADGGSAIVIDTDGQWTTRLGSLGSFFYSDISFFLTTLPWRKAATVPIPLFAGVARGTTVSEDRTVSVDVQDVFAQKFEVLSEELMIPQRLLPNFELGSIYYNNAFYGAPTSNYGLAVPIVLGDTTIIDQSTGLPSSTEGALKPIDAGYMKDSSGRTWRVGLVACHECYDIPYLYYNGSLLGTGHIAYAQDTPNNVPAIVIPSRDNGVGQRGAFWANNISNQRYIDINGERYCVILFSNTDHFQGYNAIVEGRITVAVQGFIADASQDPYRVAGPATGASPLVVSLATQIKYLILSFILNNYRGGVDPWDPYDTITPGVPGDGIHDVTTEYPGWFASPQFGLFPDGTLACRVDTNSFANVIEIENYILGTSGGNGFIGAGIIGANGKQESFRKVLQDLLVSGGYRLYTNKFGQIAITRFDPRRTNLIGTNSDVTERKDIIAGSFKIADKPEWFCDDAVYQYGLNTATNTWSQTGEQTVPFAISTLGKSRKTINLPYVFDSTTADAVIAEYLALYGSQIPRVVTWAQSLCGLEIEMLTGVPITHRVGIGGQWTENVVWPHKKVIDTTNCSVQFEALDVQARLNTIMILGDSAVLPSNWSSATPAQRVYAYLGDGTTNLFADGSPIKRL